MENTNLKQKLLAADTTQPRVLELIYQLVQNTGDRELNAQLIDLADAAARHHTAEKHQKEASAALNLYWRALHYAAKYDFDSYCLYLERYRPYEKKFYAPRRRLIKPMVEALQRLGDKEIYFLGISCPPRIGKSTLCIFFMTWMMGRYPDDASVMSGHSDPLTNGFYSEVLAIISDDVTYAWREVFPDVPLVGNSAKYTTIDLNAQKRFPTLTCRSIEGTLTGAVEVGQHGVLYCDDMVKSLEEALNLNRLQKKYDAYLNTLRDRMLDGAVELMVGTRWSVFDILGKIQDQYGDDPAYEFLVMPALDPETDESNFDYDLPGLGFSTEYYHKMRNDIDPATWAAKYMGVPYIRDGLLYPEEDLRRYYDLPQEEPDAILAVCDTADSGKNYTFLPVAYVYGDDYYIEDCVCTMALPEAFVPACGQMLARHKVNRCRFESNKAGKEYAKGVQEIVRQLHGPTSITWKYTTVNKETKIIVQSSFVKEHFLFKDSSRYTPNSAYGKMMKMLTRYVVSGKNEFDDVPDGLAMLAQYVVGQRSNTIQIIPGF